MMYKRSTQRKTQIILQRRYGQPDPKARKRLAASKGYCVYSTDASAQGVARRHFFGESRVGEADCKGVKVREKEES
jgi:hypothetical protein